MYSVRPERVIAYPVGQNAEGEAVSLRNVVDFLWQNALIITLCVVAMISLGAYYAFTTPPTYRSEAKLIIDTSQSRIVLQEPDPYSLAMESARVDSEVELVKSRAIALAVIERLRLIDEKEYNAEPGPVQKLRRWVKATTGGDEPIAADDTDAGLRRTMSAYASRLSVRRLGQSYVIEISYSSGSAARAAEITNAIAEAYISIKVQSKSDAARRGAEWLQVRLEELGQQANRAAAAVEQFKAAERIVKPSTGGSLAERQLLDTSGQLLLARGEATRLRARLDAVNGMLASGGVADVPSPDAGTNSLLIMLRQRMIDARARQSDHLSRYGPEGAAVQASANEIEKIQSEIQSELMRMRSEYQTELEAAELRQTSTDGSLESMLMGAAEQSAQYVQLAELESRASTYRRMYETMLQQFTETVQRQSFPVSDARIVTPAVAPFTPSEPKTTLILALSGILGGVAGLSVAFGRAALETRVFSGRQVEQRIGARCIGEFPRLSLMTRLRAWFLGNDRLAWRDLAVVLRLPQSEAAGALTSMKVSVDLGSRDKRPIVIGITSIAHYPMRARLASNIALLYAAEGRSALLLDADHRRLTLTKSLAKVGTGEIAEAGSSQQSEGETPSNAKRAVAPAPKNKVSLCVTPVSAIDASPPARPINLLSEGVWPERELDEGLKFATVASAEETSSPYRLHASLRRELNDVRCRYEVIVVDLPSMSDTCDARALSALFDVVVVSCEQRKTTIGQVAEAVTSLNRGAKQLIAFVVDGAPKAKTHA